jgi:cytochrome P450
LCCHPEIQDKLRNEILKEIKEKKSLTFSDVEKMIYLNQVVNETLRMIPPVPEVDKETDEDMFVGDLFIPKGTLVGMNIFGLHHNPKIWENPNEFIPERWDEEKLQKIPNFRYSFIPFSVGARDCVGKMFAKLEAPLILALILKNFKIQFDDGFSSSDVEFNFESIVRPKVLKVQLISV